MKTFKNILLFLNIAVLVTAAQSQKISMNYNSFLIGDENITSDIPVIAEAGSEFVIEVTINKGQNEKIGKFQQELPQGFIATPLETKNGRFKFKNQKIEIMWIQLPPENEFKIFYMLSVSNEAVGEYMLCSKFHYLQNKQRKILTTANKISIERSEPVISLISTESPGSTINRNSSIYNLRSSVSQRFMAGGSYSTGRSISNRNGCAPHTISFVNEFYVETKSTTYTWDFGDGVTLNQEDPTHTYYEDGIYMVSLTAFAPDGKSEVVKMELITVYEVPIADFVVNPEFVFLFDEPIYCINISSKADSYIWSFGDETTSNETEPQYYYAVPGEYTVTLIAMNQYGCSDTLAKKIIAKTGGLVFVPKKFTPELSKNNTLVPITSGVIKFNMKIFDRKGKLIFETTNEDNGWDGFCNGKLCKQGLYRWEITAAYMGGEKYKGEGDVRLFRLKSNKKDNKKIQRFDDLTIPAAKYNLQNDYLFLNH